MTTLAEVFASFAAGQAFSITSFTLTEGNQ